MTAAALVFLGVLQLAGVAGVFLGLALLVRSAGR